MPFEKFDFLEYIPGLSAPTPNPDFPAMSQRPDQPWSMVQAKNPKVPRSSVNHPAQDEEKYVGRPSNSHLGAFLRLPSWSLTPAWMKVTVLMMRRSFQGTSWYIDVWWGSSSNASKLWSWWRNEHLSFFVSTATCNTLWLQDTSGLIMGYYWSQVVGIHELTFFFNSEVFRITKCKSQKKCSTHFWVTDTPFKQPTRSTENVHQKSGKIGESSPPPAWFRPLSWWIAVPKDLPDQSCHP